MRATETSGSETGNPTCCNLRIVRWGVLPEYKSEGIASDATCV